MEAGAFCLKGIAVVAIPISRNLVPMIEEQVKQKLKLEPRIPLSRHQKFVLAVTDQYYHQKFWESGHATGSCNQGLGGLSGPCSRVKQLSFSRSSPNLVLTYSRSPRIIDLLGEIDPYHANVTYSRNCKQAHSSSRPKLKLRTRISISTSISRTYQALSDPSPCLQRIVRAE
jgi:hypothetical protein